jgi:hypothetical protein
MGNINIRYCFGLSHHQREVFTLQLDDKNLELIGSVPENPPHWSHLEFHQCPNCLLDSRQHPFCPIMLKLVNIIGRFDQILSYDQIDLEVITEERTISHPTTAQKGLSSLMGLVIASSGCPHTLFLKPMARFHLPLASEEETIYRAASMYLLAQYFFQNEGLDADFSFEGLQRIYKDMNIVNASIANRLRESSKADSSVNAIIMIGIYAKTMPYVIDDSLEEIRYLFAPYLQEG